MACEEKNRLHLAPQPLHPRLLHCGAVHLGKAVRPLGRDEQERFKYKRLFVASHTHVGVPEEENVFEPELSLI
jgi:hypothetical protein